MRKLLLILVAFSCVFSLTNGSVGFLPIKEVNPAPSSGDVKYSKVILKSASGWKLNSLKEAKSFIVNEAFSYGISPDMSGNRKWVFFCS